MLTSPITVTIDGTAHSLSRINQDNFGSTWLKRATNLEVRLQIRHSYEGKEGASQVERHNVDLVMTTWDAEGNATIQQAYTVVRSPRSADPVMAGKVAIGLNAFVTANATGIATWEN